MSQCRVTAVKSIEKKRSSGYTLCFQWCVYNYSDGNKETGYRFIWKDPEGRLKTSRGQARIPSIDIIIEMIQEAKDKKWDFEGEILLDKTNMAT